MGEFNDIPTHNDNKLIIGITGGIGSGKSTLAKLIEDKGHPVIYTDLLARDIINTDANVKELIKNAFGSHAFLNGQYNTAYIAAIVFNDNNKLSQLNQIIFPYVIDKLVETIGVWQDSEHKLIFVESALLFEMELEKGFDYIISVSASLETRIKRLLETRNLTEEDVKKRIKKQMPQEDKNKLADFVINNDGDSIMLKHSVDALIPILLELPNKDFDNE